LGPALAYGGPAPTPTDALVITGDIDNGDRDKAVDGLTPLAKTLGVSVDTIADNIIALACKTIMSAARQLIQRINRKPVYTVHELQEGYQVNPNHIHILGGPAPYFAKHLKKYTDNSIDVVARWNVANAIGAALARTTCEVNFFADTQQGIAEAPEENYNRRIDRNFDSEAAVQEALNLLKEKAVQRGANPENLETEIVEALQFNMVRGFESTGKNIRVKVQVKPGLIRGYEHLIARLTDGV
jgi:uncharacterized protein YajQ (UPF0234 family)